MQVNGNTIFIMGGGTGIGRGLVDKILQRILKSSPDVTEICVERMKPLRFAGRLRRSSFRPSCLGCEYNGHVQHMQLE